MISVAGLTEDISSNQLMYIYTAAHVVSDQCIDIVLFIDDIACLSLLK